MKRLPEIVRGAKRVYLVGNGGSYANAVHIANDLIGAGIKAYTLDPATLTATANDYGYRHVFSRWISTVGEEGDLLIALSGSGESLNILDALRAARKKGMQTVAILGRVSSASLLADHPFEAGGQMQRAEEYQVKLGHRLMKALHDRR